MFDRKNIDELLRQSCRWKLNDVGVGMIPKIWERSQTVYTNMSQYSVSPFTVTQGHLQ